MSATTYHTIEYWLDDVHAWLTVPDDPESDYLVLDLVLRARVTQSVVLEVLLQPRAPNGLADGPLIVLDELPLRLMSRAGSSLCEARAVLSHLSRERLSEWYFRLRAVGERLTTDPPSAEVASWWVRQPA